MSLEQHQKTTFVGKDQRIFAIVAENFAASLNPYSFTGVEYLPATPPYIIAANHDVLGGDYTHVPYDALVINHWLRKVKGSSPYLLAKLSSDSALYKKGEANRYVSPVMRFVRKALFDSMG